MKTFNCWLIANVLPYVVAISCYFAIGGLGLRMNCFSFWDYFVFYSGGKNTITALLSFLSFFYWLDAEGYGSTVLPC